MLMLLLSLLLHGGLDHGASGWSDRARHMVCISWYALGMIDIHTDGRCLGRSWIHHHTQGGRDQSVNVCQGDGCRYGISMNAMLSNSPHTSWLGPG